MEGSYVQILPDQNSHAMPFGVNIGLQTDSPIFLALFSSVTLALVIVLWDKARAKRKNSSSVQLSSAVVLAAVLALTLFHDTKSSSRGKVRNVKTSEKDVPREDSVLGLGTMRPMVCHAGAANEQTPVRRSSRLAALAPPGKNN